MELVIRIDLDKAKLSLPEIFRLIGNCRWTDEASEVATAGLGAPVRDDRSGVIGEWEIEAPTTASHHPEESAYRAAAMARYARPRQIEVDRFATVSQSDDGAYVQGWLHVPRTDLISGGQETPARKPPQSAFRTENARRKAS